MLKSTLYKLHAAAVIFVERRGCSAKEIADILNVPVNSVYHYAKQTEWNETLDTLGYDGDRCFSKKTTRDPEKENPNLFVLAKQIYLLERNSGRDHKKAVSAVVKELPALKRRRVNDWVKKYEWDNGD